MNDEVHAADPRLRRWAIWLLLGTTVLGAILLYVLNAALQAKAADLPLDGLSLAYAGVSALVASTGLGLGWSLWQEAARIRREDRYPPSDMRTLRNVPICRGAQARRIASGLRIAAVMSAGLGSAVLIWSLWSLRQLG